MRSMALDHPRRAQLAADVAARMDRLRCVFPGLALAVLLPADALPPFKSDPRAGRPRDQTVCAAPATRYPESSGTAPAARSH